MASTIFTKLNSIWIDEDGILNVKVIKEGEMDLDEVKRCFESYRTLGVSKENKVLQLMDFSISVTITKEAREYVDEHAPEFFIASAVVSESLAIRIIVNFMSMFRPQVPLKMFRSKDVALEWLHGHMVKKKIN